jgi:hypothetical protein
MISYETYFFEQDLELLWTSTIHLVSIRDTFTEVLSNLLDPIVNYLTLLLCKTTTAIHVKFLNYYHIYIVLTQYKITRGRYYRRGGDVTMGIVTA